MFGRSIITGFARLDGWPVAVMAGDPLFDGGAWTADACNKIIRFVDMAQTFHLPSCIWSIVRGSRSACAPKAAR